MKVLYRYIGFRLAFAWSLVFLIMAALFSILELVGQLDDIGEGSYQVADAFSYVAYTLPGRVLNLAAVSSMLGGIIALGSLADSEELLAMRACGVSVFQIGLAVLSAGTVIMLGVLVLAQFVVPPLERAAKIHRELALSDEGSLLPSGGFWTRGENRFINVRASSGSGRLTDVSIYEFDEHGEPTRYIMAREATIDEDGRWTGRDARQLFFSGSHVTEQKIDLLPLGVFLNTRQVSILSITPAMLSIEELYQYIGVLRGSGQNADPYLLALWEKTTLPLKVAAMIFFALPFVFGTAREASPGRRVTLGTLVGISYYYFDQALGYLGLLLALHPAFTTLLPMGIITLLATWLLLRVP